MSLLDAGIAANVDVAGLDTFLVHLIKGFDGSLNLKVVVYEAAHALLGILDSLENGLVLGVADDIRVLEGLR